MKLVLCLLFCVVSAWAQGQTRVAPDCVLGSLFFSGTGNSTAFDNRPNSTNSGPPCTLWSLQWSAQSGVSSLTINIEGAPDSNGSPGSFSSLAMSSTFPSGKLNYSSSTGYSPWMMVSVTAVGSSGNINATLIGWREDQGSISGGSGGTGCTTAASPCFVQGVTATGVAATENPLFDGAIGDAGTKIPSIYGTTPASVTLSASGLTQIVAASSGKVIHVGHISIAFVSAVNFQLEYGTSTNCGSGTTALTGVYQNITAIALDFAPDTLNVPSGNALCANLGSAVSGGGLIKTSTF